MFNIRQTIQSVTKPGLSIKKSRKEKVASAPDAREPREELRRVLERAAADSCFVAQLIDEGSKALQGYNLTLPDKAALLSGDINWIETRLGKLDDRLSTWLWCRLQQESW